MSRLDRERPYSPEEILGLSSQIFPSQDRKQLHEARIVAEMVRRYKHSTPTNEDQHILLVDTHDEIPDVRIAYVDGSGRYLQILDIEIVSFTRYSESEGLEKFLERTKLSEVYAYPAGTVLLCWVELPLKEPQKAARQMAQTLQRRSQELDCWQSILLFNHSKAGNWYLAELYPAFEEVRLLDD
jgi:hypothetical protein